MHPVKAPIADGLAYPNDVAASVPGLASMILDLVTFGSPGVRVNCGRVVGLRAM